METPALQISKLDAAHRQLACAIKIYFAEGDPIAVHTLTAAAYNLLRDLTHARQAPPMKIKGVLADSVKPEHRKEFIGWINQAENFFKHADRDHKEILEFNPGFTEFLLIDACEQYNRLSGENPSFVRAFNVWFMANHPDLFDEEAPSRYGHLVRSNSKSIRTMGRNEFYATIMAAIHKIDSATLKA